MKKANTKSQKASANDAAPESGQVGPSPSIASATDPSANVGAEVKSAEGLEEKVASLEESLLRAKADFQNLQRRAAQDKMESIRYANVELMRSLVGVADDFERSLEAVGGADEVVAVADGVRLVYENFMKSLQSHGLERIPALYEPFDPHIHEALLQQPCEDHPPGTVIEEVAKGYRLRDRVVRPARVIVAKAAEVVGERASTDQGEESGSSQPSSDDE